MEVGQYLMYKIPYLIILVVIFVIGVVMGAFGQKLNGFSAAVKIVNTNGSIGPQAITSSTPIPTKTDNDVPEEFRGRLSLFVLAGQSNMSGYG